MAQSAQFHLPGHIPVDNDPFVLKSSTAPDSKRATCRNSNSKRQEKGRVAAAGSLSLSREVIFRVGRLLMNEDRVNLPGTAGYTLNRFQGVHGN